jgi:hypothetical protein
MLNNSAMVAQYRLRLRTASVGLDWSVGSDQPVGRAESIAAGTLSCPTIAAFRRLVFLGRRTAVLAAQRGRRVRMILVARGTFPSGIPGCSPYTSTRYSGGL